MADRLRGDGVDITSYDPENRDNGMQVVYAVHETGARWFIPYNNNASNADQLAQCKKLVGKTDNNSEAGIESVA